MSCNLCLQHKLNEDSTLISGFLIVSNPIEQRTCSGQCENFIMFMYCKTSDPARLKTAKMGCCLERIRSFDETPHLRHVEMLSFRPETTIEQEISMMKALNSLPQIFGLQT